MQLAITYTTFVSTLAHTNAACFALLAQNPFLCTTQRSDFQSKSHPEWVETRHAMMISSYLLCIRHLRPSSAVVQIKQENNSNSTIGSQESDSTGASKKSISTEGSHVFRPHVSANPLPQIHNRQDGISDCHRQPRDRAIPETRQSHPAAGSTYQTSSYRFRAKLPGSNAHFDVCLVCKSKEDAFSVFCMQYSNHRRHGKAK